MRQKHKPVHKDSGIEVNFPDENNRELCLQGDLHALQARPITQDKKSIDSLLLNQEPDIRCQLEHVRSQIVDSGVTSIKNANSVSSVGSSLDPRCISASEVYRPIGSTNSLHYSDNQKLRDHNILSSGNLLKNNIDLNVLQGKLQGLSDLRNSVSGKNSPGVLTEGQDDCARLICDEAIVENNSFVTTKACRSPYVENKGRCITQDAISTCAPSTVHSQQKNFQSVKWMYRNWIEAKHADCKTKSINRIQYENILKVLRDEIDEIDISPSSELSKFSDWVRSHKFLLGDDTKPWIFGTSEENRGKVLWILKASVRISQHSDAILHVSTTESDYVKVAIIEDFFDILYDTHVKYDTCDNKVIGQKKLHRLVSDKYAFLSRDAIGMFLKLCPHCQEKRSFQSAESLDWKKLIHVPGNSTHVGSLSETLRRNLGSSNTPLPAASGDDCVVVDLQTKLPNYKEEKMPQQSALANGSLENSPSLEAGGCATGLDLSKKQRKRKLSEDAPGSLDSSSIGDDVDCKDDDEEEEDGQSIVSGKVDEERLKAFNLFVRFFVDENMDRMVPISKQPKEKLNAILEACDRQFPEFYERARKRVRTYLKACRRNGRKHGGMPTPTDTPRTTPSHLTSPTAESILEKALNAEREYQAQLQEMEGSGSRREAREGRSELTKGTSEQRRSKKPRVSPPNYSSALSAMGMTSNTTGLTSLTSTTSGIGISPTFIPPLPFTSPFFPIPFAGGSTFSNVACTAGGNHKDAMVESLPADQMDWASFEALFKAQLSQSDKDDSFCIKQTINSFRQVANFLKQTADHFDEQLQKQSNNNNNGSVF